MQAPEVCQNNATRSIGLQQQDRGSDAMQRRMGEPPEMARHIYCVRHRPPNRMLCEQHIELDLKGPVRAVGESFAPK